MCYSRKDRDLEREARWITESRLMEEEARHRQEEHDRGGGGRRASDHRLPARFSALDELPRPHMGSYSARDPCRVARATGARYPAARSARPAGACFDADRSERAERHA